MFRTDTVVDGAWFTLTARTDGQPGWQVEVDDEVAWDEDARLDRLVDALHDAPGVTVADRDDREVIEVEGVIDADDLAAWITDWWNERR